ncbi:MAG: hypothetical protein ABJE95_17715 [Byssovorax sp.]
MDRRAVHATALDADPSFKSRTFHPGKPLAQALAHEVTAMVLAYRNDEDVLQARLGSLIENRHAEVTGIRPEIRNTYSRRVARAVAGGVASLGGLAMFLGGGIWVAHSRSWLGSPPSPSDGHLTALLLGSVAAAALSYLPARLIAYHEFDRALSHGLSLSGKVRVDLVRLERAQPRRIAAEILARAEPWGASLPLIAVALLGPLLLHLLVWIGFTGGGAALRLGAFDAWIGLTAPMAGLAHLVLAFRAAVYGQKLKATSTDDLRRSPSDFGWRSVLSTAVAGLIPGAILVLIPPALIFVTGLLIVPFSFYSMSRVVVAERDLVAELAE